MLVAAATCLLGMNSLPMTRGLCAAGASGGSEETSTCVPPKLLVLLRDFHLVAEVPYMHLALP